MCGVDLHAILDLPFVHALSLAIARSCCDDASA
jgi:hypothetical protein